MSFDGEEAPVWLDIGDYYADYGIHFVNAMGIVMSSSSYYPPRSGGTVITAIIPPTYTGGDGHVTINFDFPVSVFGAYATSAESLSLSCSDSAGASVGTAYLNTPNLSKEGSPFGPNQNIEVRGQGIVRCVFDGSNNLYGFDDFYFSHVDAGVSCNPQSPERGEETTCAAKGFAVVNAWSFVPDSAGFPTVRDSVPNNEQEWKGSMVASGTVRVLGWRKVADAFVRPRDSASVHVEVRARGWTPLEMPEAPKFAGQGNTTIVPKPNLDMTYGLFHLVPPDFTVKTVLSGPNRGYSWLDPEPKLPASKVYVSPALDGKGAWAAIQTGEYNGSKMSPNGRPYCTLADLQAFKKKVERHEGLTSDANSHYGIWKTQLAKSDVHKKLESIVVASSTAAEDTVQRRNDIKAAGQLAYDRWQEWKEDHQPLQVAFDSTEYGNDGIPKMAGCDFVPFPTVQTPDSTR